MALAAALLLAALAGHASTVTADEVILKNGMHFSGTTAPIKGLTNALAKQNSGPTNIYPILLVDTGLKRIYLPQRFQLVDVVQDDLSRHETFKVPHRNRTNSRTLAALGSIADVTPFDEFGRRTITITTPQGRLPIVQQMTEINPRHVAVSAVNLLWEHGIATSSLPPGDLERILRRVVNPNSPNDRMAVARFFIQAAMYQQADKELQSIVRDFPEYKDRVEEASLELRQLQAGWLLRELRRRQSAGQHRLAYAAAQQFPQKDMAADVLRQVRELLTEYESAREKFDKVRLLLGELPAGLEDTQQREALRPMRSIVLRQLEQDYESLQRLDAFLKQADNESLPADVKLSLAYSGWVAGSANAVDDLDAALRLWDAQFRILEILRTDEPNRRNALLAELLNLEGIGPQTVAGLVPFLPVALETPDIRPGAAHTVQVTDAGLTASYKVLLPTEYPTSFTPHHSYPLIVALRPAERSTDELLEWWGGTEERPGQSQRHGYIVIAPEYAPDGQRDYTGDVSAHQIVLSCLRDARLRFHVDSDRIYLAGHGMGGDAAFDIGMSHPDLFAGVIPITGRTPDVCKWYWEQANYTAWYVVGGELDRDSLAYNANVLNRMLRYGHDLIYVEYISRGYESYYEEIHQLFEWMDLHRRTKFVDEIDVRALRPGDNHFFWFRADGLPDHVGQTGRPLILKARVTPGNSVYITSSAEKTTIWLSPEFIDFDQRVNVKLGGRQRFNDFLRPNIPAMLEDLRLRGDREKLYWVRLDLD